MRAMSGAHGARLLKADALGRVERVVTADGSVRVRRVACGGRIPGSGLVARALLARERRALAALEGLAGVPRALGGRAGVLERTWIEGAPLSAAEELPADFFDRLDELVRALHARGVCHNDLHKEQNVLVAAGGWPALLDFQLASVHRRGSRVFVSRARDDLRHVEKHRRRYTRDGRGPAGGAASTGGGPRPGPLADGARVAPRGEAGVRIRHPAYPEDTRRRAAPVQPRSVAALDATAPMKSLLALVLLIGAAPALAQVTQRVSVSSAGLQGNEWSVGSVISADGRFVAFSSLADNLVPGDTNGVEDVFVRDRLSGTTERASVSSGGVEQCNGNSSVGLAISSDGRFVAFTSPANNLVPGDTNLQPDVFVRDRTAGRRSA
jgi:hypothetical protein